MSLLAFFQFNLTLNNSKNVFKINKTYSKIYFIDKKYSIIEKEIRDKAEILINSFPLSFTSNFGIYSAYSYALDIRLVWIEEDKIETKDTDFGITCI